VVGRADLVVLDLFLGLMPKETWVKSRRIGIHGHQTSLRLEPEFWYWLRQVAAECGTTATKLIESIVIAKNPNRSLSSALRVWIAGYFHNQAPQHAFPDPESGFVLRTEHPRRSRKRYCSPTYTVCAMRIR
jgi:predicted DNA-binding ribbon-helix-helix protein